MANGITLAFTMIAILIVGCIIITILINMLTKPLPKTPKYSIKKIVKAMDIKEEDNVIDICCRDGQVILEIYRQYQCNCFGYDILPFMVMHAKLNKFLSFPFAKKLFFDVSSIYKADLEDKNILYCYLEKDYLKSMKKILKKYINNGGRVYSYKNRIEDMKETKKIEIDKGNYLYLYNKR